MKLNGSDTASFGVRRPPGMGEDWCPAVRTTSPGAMRRPPTDSADLEHEDDQQDDDDEKRAQSYVHGPGIPASVRRHSVVGTSDGRGVCRLTCSQSAATSSAKSARTRSKPAPQVTTSRVPSRTKMRSSPASPLTVSL